MKAFKLLGTLLLTTLFYFSCGKEDFAIHQLNQQFELGFHKQATLAQEEITIQFVGVDDSRCLKGDQCIWEGSVTAELLITRDDGEPQTIRIDTRIFPRDTIGNFVYTIKDATPRKVGRNYPKDKKYCIALEVSNL